MITLGQSEILVIISLAVLWYVAFPTAGTFVVRRGWRIFRRRFDELRLKPILDYKSSREEREGEYRFTGRFESLSEDHILWIRNDDLTVPVDLRDAMIYLLPDDPGEGFPERIKWEKLSALTGEARIYVGGSFVIRDKRRIFASSHGNPLQVILYEGPDHTLTARAIRGGRHKNKYLNFVTPYALVFGAFSQIMTAVFFFNRPARRPAMITAFIALFAPLIPFIPPGILFALIYRRLWWRARFCRAYRDLARLPLLYFSKDENHGRLPDGSLYGARQYDTLPSAFFEREFPFIIPAGEKEHKDKWYVFGILNGTDSGSFPSPPGDPFAVYGAFPGKPETLAKRYARKAWILEIISWLVFGASLVLNLIFIRALILMTGLLAF